MSNNDIIRLIEELKELRIRELQVLSSLEATVQQNRLIHARTIIDENPTTTRTLPNIIPTNTIPTNIAPTRTLPNIIPTSTIPTNIARTATPTSNENTIKQFEKGYRVIISNRVTRSRKNLPTTRGNRIAIVTGIAINKVYIRTLNSLDTWRIPKNLRQYPHDNE
jgi:hypothetical protein